MTTDSLSALYFPATWMPPATVARLLLPLGRLVSYRPAEGPAAILQPLAATGLVETYPPAPFDKEIDHFRRLLTDMQTHAAEFYQAHLSSLAGGKGEDPESGWRLVARRLRQSAAPGKAVEESLWRARLYLALAESQAVLEDEIHAGIQAVSRREAELLRQLQGEKEELAELSLLPAAPMATAAVRDEQLLAAWGLLYLADPNPGRPWLLATAREESAGVLFERYERAIRCSPDKLITLALPQTVSGSEEEFSAIRQALRTAAGPLLARLKDLLSAAAFAPPGAEEIAGSGQAAELASEWRQTMTRHADGASTKPTAALTFYRLAGMSFPELFGLLCRRENAKTSGSFSPHAVLAVLTEPSSPAGHPVN